MKWIKKGHIYKPNGEHSWMNSHTTPAAVVELKDRIRVFFSTRSKLDLNGNFISYASFLDLDKDNMQKILYIHNKPIIELGDAGTFDEYGVMIAKPVVFNNSIYLYYMGWQRLSGETAPYQVSLGLAISLDMGISFKKYSKGPILGIDLYDPISIGNISVVNNANRWEMWYTSFKRWEMTGAKPTPSYNIKYAISSNGITWKKTDNICIQENELGGVATPTVIKQNGKYHMWFGFRKPYDKFGNVGGYKIGYAISTDGIEWERDDSLCGITVSDTGWDSDMICAPHVLEINGKIYMFYCGNGFGLEGFGYAELDGKL